MKTKRYRTDRWLWFWIAFTLFVACWFQPCVQSQDGREILVVSLFRDFGFWTFNFILPFVCLFSVWSILLGWLVQRLVVIARTRKQDKIAESSRL
jgi:hypothetical protein